jgi:hypothetical protein
MERKKRILGIMTKEKTIQQTIILHKGTDKFVFRWYRPEDKLPVFAAAIEMAICRQNGFDEKDAAFVGFKLGLITSIELATGCLRIC